MLLKLCRSKGCEPQDLMRVYLYMVRVFSLPTNEVTVPCESFIVLFISSGIALRGRSSFLSNGSIFTSYQLLFCIPECFLDSEKCILPLCLITTPDKKSRAHLIVLIKCYGRKGMNAGRNKITLFCTTSPFPSEEVSSVVAG